LGKGDEEKQSLRPDIIGAFIIAGVLILCIVAALMLAPTFSDMGFQAFGEEEATNPIWAFFYIGLVIVMAVVIVLLIKFGFQKFIHIAFLGAVFFTIIFVLTPMITIILADEPAWEKEDDLSLFPPPDALPSQINGNRLDYVDSYIIWDEFGLAAYNSTGLFNRYFGDINTVIRSDVSGDNRSELVIGDDSGLKVFTPELELELIMDLDMNITSLSSSQVLGLKRESLIASTMDGEVTVFIPSAGAFTAIELSDDAGKVRGNVLGVFLSAGDDETFSAYVLTDEGLYYQEISFSIMPMVISGSIAAFFAGIAVILLLMSWRSER